MNKDHQQDQEWNQEVNNEEELQGSSTYYKPTKDK
jgi:hypothetical protein